MHSNFNQTQNIIQQQNIPNNANQKSQPVPQVNNKANMQASLPEESDEELLKEGYLPEIYFLLKSDNPADW